MLRRLLVPEEMVLFREMPLPRDASTSLTSYQPNGTIQGGWRIVNANGEGCTAGFAAIDLQDHTPVFVTNSHCTVQPHGLDGGQMRQPNVNGVLWGTEKRDPPTYWCLSWTPYACRHSDSPSLPRFSETVMFRTILTQEGEFRSRGVEHRQWAGESKRSA
jgi:hypothetical protein